MWHKKRRAWEWDISRFFLNKKGPFWPSLRPSSANTGDMSKNPPKRFKLVWNEAPGDAKFKAPWKWSAPGTLRHGWCSVAVLHGGSTWKIVGIVYPQPSDRESCMSGNFGGIWLVFMPLHMQITSNKHQKRWEFHSSNHPAMNARRHCKPHRT